MEITAQAIHTTRQMPVNIAAPFTIQVATNNIKSIMLTTVSTSFAGIDSVMSFMVSLYLKESETSSGQCVTSYTLS